MINQIIIGGLVSISFIIGYLLRLETKKEVDNFFKDHKGFLKCKKYLEIRAILYGIALGLSLPFIPTFSLVLFALGVIEGGVFAPKNLKKSLSLTALTFIPFILVFLIMNLTSI
ncbi:MAG: hypothetical protein JSW73_02400 [Candidatus Woesearchaeota archaeon]|nr:MAG: hypothetical protein JSW73_02400 [Candidatus Woesearchaeota archaeon]